MRAWITKYALTSGICEVEAEQCRESPSMISWGGWNGYAHGEGRGWHRTREGAMVRAEAMRKKKIESLKKSIKKLEALRFQ
jgi:hypothetical protein